MLIGAAIFATDYAMRPDELARELEQRRYESLWLPEHTHIPASRRTPYPVGGDLPKEYWHTYDPFLALTAAAAATKKLRLATGICLIIQRDPIITAKEVASLDVLSGGRFIFGIGGGWNAEEMENHGTNFKKRWRVLRERVLAMKEIWTKEEAEFHGEFVNFDKVWSHPKPAQKPHPPVLMGGYGPTTFERVIQFCDGWLPIGFQTGVTELLQRITDLRHQAEGTGRDPKTISISVFGPDPQPATIDELAKAGVERVVLMLPAAQRDTVLPLIDKYTSLMR